MIREKRWWSSSLTLSTSSALVAEYVKTNVLYPTEPQYTLLRQVNNEILKKLFQPQLLLIIDLIVRIIFIDKDPGSKSQVLDSRRLAYLVASFRGMITIFSHWHLLSTGKDAIKGF